MDQSNLSKKCPQLAQIGRQSAFHELSLTVHGYDAATAAAVEDSTLSLHVDEFRFQREITFLERQRGHTSNGHYLHTCTSLESENKHGHCLHPPCNRIENRTDIGDDLSVDAQEDRKFIRRQYFCPAILCSFVFPPLGIPALVLAIWAYRLRGRDDQLTKLKANLFAAVSWRLMEICLYIFAFGYVIGMFFLLALSSLS